MQMYGMHLHYAAGSSTLSSLVKRYTAEYECTLRIAQGLHYLSQALCKSALSHYLLVVLLVWPCLSPSRKFARTLRRTGRTHKVLLQGRTRTRPAGLVALLTVAVRACMFTCCGGYEVCKNRLA
jgi:hypothetical protein